MAKYEHALRAFWMIGIVGFGAWAEPARALASQDDPLLLVDAEETSGTVIAVIAPDELRLALVGEEVVVCLEDLRLPPVGSRLYEQGRDLLSRRLEKRSVRFRVRDQASRELRRIRGSVFLEEQDVRGELIEAGLAAYCPARAGNQELLRRQDEALEARRGLWADVSAVSALCGPK